MEKKPIWERDSFFKVMIGDFQTRLVISRSFQILDSILSLSLSRSLFSLSQKIPPFFSRKHLSGETLVKSVLRCRGGRRWNVMLRREGESLFFGQGWECFVADLAIQLGEFLVFVYDGDLGFDVKIYGISCCEKEDPFTAVKAEKEEEEEGEMRRGISVKTSSRSVRASKRNREVLNGPIILGGLKVWRNKKALQSALAFKSQNPFFISIYRSSCQESMTIPISFVRECDLGKMETIILHDQTERSWPVKIAHRLERTAFAKGWPNFRAINHLEEGDVCVFEFLAAVGAFRVHIFQA